MSTIQKAGKDKRRIIFAVSLACAVGLGGLALSVAPTLSQGEEAPAEEAAAEQEAPAVDAETVIAGGEGTVNEVINDDQYPGKSYMDEIYTYWDDVAETYAPEIRTMPDGTMVQRTPTEYTVDPAAWQITGNSNSYNTYWLDADNRGCESCHPDLNATLQEMEYLHPVSWNDELGNKTTVQQCLFCHSYAPGYITKQYEFGTLMHGIHFGRNRTVFEDSYGGNCMSCHNATENGEGLELWDLTKYDRLWGINDVADVQGEFSVEQETVQSLDGTVSIDWVHSYYDKMRRAAGVNGLDMTMPQSMFDEWTITIEGNVNEPYTAKLSDLVAEAEAAGVVITKPSKMVCNWNPVGSGGISNSEITGIPVSWLVEKAGGYKEGTTGVRALRADGSSQRAFPLEKLESNEALLVYKIDGEYLDATRGFPCTNWVEGVDAQINSKQVNVYRVTDEDIDYSDASDGNPNGWHNADGVPMNKPNATILGVQDGLIIQNGQPYTFHGYADAFDEKIATLEFSMDRGKTWTAYEVGDMDENKVLWWSFTYTPQAEGAYCLTVRATTETGIESYETHTVMFNAKDVMPSVEETTVVENAAIVAPKNNA